MTTIRLAVTWNRHAMAQSFSNQDLRPALLCSLPYVEDFQKARTLQQLSYRDWTLDSGAFSIWNVTAKYRRQGSQSSWEWKEITLEQYIDWARRLRQEDPTMREVISLDVHENPRQTLKNTEAMWKAGIEAIPTYHMGEPTWALDAMARDYPKIALGGLAPHRPNRWDWCNAVFSRIWPKRVHGLGVGNPRGIMAVPWHSVDTSSWVRPLAFGGFRSGRRKLGKRFRYRPPHEQWNLHDEVVYYLDLEAQAQARWAETLKEVA